MHEAESKDNVSPLFIGLDSFQEVLVDHGGVGTRNTSLDTLWRLSGDLNGHLEQTEREIFVGLASNPETEILVDLLAYLGLEDFFHLSHEFKGKMAIVKNDPETVSKAVLDVGTSRHVHLFSHGNLESRDLLFASQFIDCGGRVGTGGKQEQDWLVGRRFLPDIGN